MLRKFLILLAVVMLIPLAGCSPFKNVRTIDPKPISSFDTLVIRDFITENVMVDENFNVGGIIVDAIRRNRSDKPYFTPAKKREFSRSLTDAIYSEVKGRRIFSNVYKNVRAPERALVLDGRITKINVDGFYGRAPSHITMEIEGSLLNGPRGRELVIFNDEKSERTLDTMRELAKDIADYLEKNR